MAEFVVSGVAKGIIGIAGKLALPEVALIRGVKDEINKLKDTVSNVEGVLMDAEERQHNSEAIKVWLKTLKDAMCDADDLLDEISTEALRREVMTRDKKAKKVRILFSKPNQLAYGFRMGHKVKKMRERLAAVAANRQFHLDERREEIQVRNESRRQTHSVVCAEDVIGREEDKKAIIGSLLDPNVKENVSVLPIVGIGGLGKTTLAKLVFNDEEIENHFELKLWVHVSQNFDVKIIVKKILECIKNESPNNLEMNTLVNNLRKEINGKRYLLVLDDVWNENHEEWFSLKDILVGVKSGSRILVTTRSKIVAEITKSRHSHELKGLEDQQSWSLLKKLVFGEGEEPEIASFVNIGNEILKKCGGIPLAIRAIAGPLHLKNSVGEWQSFKDNELLNISQNDSGIYQTLKLSYDHLPFYLKQCFAFCSIFPKDYEIEKESLIYMWMAQGFIKLYNENNCPEDVGDEYFMDLLRRSFFQEVEKDPIHNFSRFKIHDLMHDLAIKVMGSESTTIYSKEKDIDEKTCHVSFGHILYSSYEIPISLYKARRLRTFLLPCQPEYGNINSDHLTCSEIIASFKFIRLLDLHNMEIKTIPNSIKKLKHLRYLDLSENRDIEMLPNSIVKLHNLQTLKLVECHKLKELPRDINKLVNLRFLEIGGHWGLTHMLTHMPDGLGQLTNLVQFKLGSCEKCQNLPPLDQLPSLKIIELYNLDCLEHISDLERDNSGSLFYPSLEKLKIWGCHNLKGWWRGRRDSLPSFPRLSFLDINCHNQLTSFPLFPFLERLSLCKCSLKQSLQRMMINNKTSSGNPPLIASAPAIVAPLSKLSYMYIQNTKEALPEECLPNLISLRTLFLCGCPFPQGIRYLTALRHLNVWDSEVVDLSKDWDEMEWQGLRTLLSLQFYHLPKLVSLPMGLQYVSSLQNLEIKECHSLIAIPEWICKLTSLQSLKIGIIAGLESLPEGIGALTSLQTLQIWACPKLESLPEGIGALTSLQTLKIMGCSKLESLPEGIGALTSLQTLHINACSILLKQIREDWYKISHIPNLRGDLSLLERRAR